MTALLQPWKDELFCRLAGILELCSDKQGSDCLGCPKYIGCEKLWGIISNRTSQRRVNNQDYESYLTMLMPILNG